MSSQTVLDIIEHVTDEEKVMCNEFLNEISAAYTDKKKLNEIDNRLKQHSLQVIVYTLKLVKEDLQESEKTSTQSVFVIDGLLPSFQIAQNAILPNWPTNGSK